MNQLTIHLALFWGLLFTTWSFILTVHPKFKSTLLELMATNKVRVLIGTFSFVVGLIHLFYYQNWSLDYRGIMTVCGWIALIQGLFLIMDKRSISLVKSIFEFKYFDFILPLMYALGFYLLIAWIGLFGS